MTSRRFAWWRPMSWLGGKDVEVERDLGATLVRTMRNKLQVNSQWAIERSHGFRWWPSDFSQEIWTEEIDTGVGIVAHNLWVRTDVLRAPATQSAVLDAAVRAFAPLATLHGFQLRRISGDAILSLVSSVAVHPQTSKVLATLAVDAAVIQLSDTVMLRALNAELLDGAGIWSSGHPTNGVRREPDAMCRACELVVRPIGARPSHCSSGMLQTVADGVFELFEARPQRQEARSLSYRLEHDGRVLELTVNADSHPLLGSGALVTLETHKPVADSEKSRAILSAQSLDADATRLPIHRVGSWCVSPKGRLAFVAFLPNASLGSADPLLQVVATQFIRARLTV